MIGVLVSGEGTNLQALLDAGLPVVAVASNRGGAAALDRAPCPTAALLRLALLAQPAGILPFLRIITVLAWKVIKASIAFTEPLRLLDVEFFGSELLRSLS